MTHNFWSKDPTKLACPQCQQILDAGASFKPLRLLANKQFACTKCGAKLEKKVRSYNSTVPLILMVLSSSSRWDNLSPWNFIVAFSALLVYIYLVGKEIQSAHLVLMQTDTDNIQT